MCLENELHVEKNDKEIIGYVICFKYPKSYASLYSKSGCFYIKDKKYYAKKTNDCSIYYGFHGFTNLKKAKKFKSLKLLSPYAYPEDKICIIKCKFKGIIAKGDQRISFYKKLHKFPAFRARERTILEEVT